MLSDSIKTILHAGNITSVYYIFRLFLTLRLSVKIEAERVLCRCVNRILSNRHRWQVEILFLLSVVTGKYNGLTVTPSTGWRICTRSKQSSCHSFKMYGVEQILLYFQKKDMFDLVIQINIKSRCRAVTRRI